METTVAKLRSYSYLWMINKPLSKSNSQTLKIKKRINTHELDVVHSTRR